MVKSTIHAARIQIEGMVKNLIKILYINEPVSPPICMVKDFTDKTEALISFGVSELSITSSGIVAIPNMK